MRVIYFMLLALVFCGVSGAASPPLNILMICVDDLRPELNSAYGQTFLHTPNLDEFKETSLTFERAYVQQSKPEIAQATNNPSFVRSVVVDFCFDWLL